MDGGSDDQRQNHRQQDAADHGNRQRFQHLRSRAHGERKRQHSGYRGERGHDDRPQPAAARLNHRFFQRESGGSESLLGIEQQNTVLGHDANHHDHPHERRDVERGAGDEQGEKHSADREHGRRQNREGRGKRPELEQQNNEDQHHRQNEHEDEIPKRFLLHLVGSAV